MRTNSRGGWMAIGIALAGMAACKKDPGPPPPPPPVTIDARGAAIALVGNAVQVAGNGLTAEEEHAFYVTPEGSELFPLGWFLRLDVGTDNVPFAEHLERFGLIFPDQQTDTWRRPIGLTTATPTGVPWEMIGVNCAACHVAEIHYGEQEQRLRVDGAPGHFDIQKFYNDLLSGAKATLHDRRKLLKMLGLDLARLLPTHGHGPGVDDTSGLPHGGPGGGVLPGRGPDLDNLATIGHAGADLSGEIDRIIADEIRDFDTDYGAHPELLAALLRGDGDPRATLAHQPDPTSFDPTTLEAIAHQPDLGVLAPAVNDRKGIVQWGKELAANVRLLLARLKFLENAGGRSEHDTAPLYGRVDAFGFARNFLFGSPGHFTANLAPISYPHLWGFKEAKWLHWNGNTNSVMERNIGQALGVGAVATLAFCDDPDDQAKLAKCASSVLVENLHALELLAGKLRPPAWPAMFPPTKAEGPRGAIRGKAVYHEQKCDTCHDAVTMEDGLKVFPMMMFAGNPQATDPGQANEFASDLLAGGKFDAKLSKVLAAVEAAYVKHASPAIPAATVDAWNGQRRGVVWRSPLGYQARPLAGIWAAAPYLHNNSVPTLYQLMLPVKDRAPVFLVGDHHFDPKEVGYVHALPAAGAASVADPNQIYDTSKPGNSNVGHAYFTSTSDDDRWALVEYLKTL